MKIMLSNEWGIAVPELIITVTILLLLFLDGLAPKTFSRRRLAPLALTGVLIAFVSLLGLLSTGKESILYDTFLLDSFAKAFKLLLLGGGFLVILLAAGFSSKEGFNEYRGEFYYLFLTGLLGAMFIASSGDLVTLFAGLELLSLSAYIMTGIQKRNEASNESPMKYVINGGIASAVTLFGMSYLYGIAGSTNLREINEVLIRITDSQILQLLSIAFLLILAGFSLKAAAAPFHIWTCNGDEGPFIPAAVFISTISKTAVLLLLLRIIITVFFTASGDVYGGFTFLEKNSIYLSVLAGLTMVIGNVIALRQTSVPRLLAYSSIAHAGYILTAIATVGGGYFLLDTLWFYLLAYLLMNIGAFTVLQHISAETGSVEYEAFAGLGRRSPLLAAAMSVFLLSLAGIPGTAGFIGKIHIFLGAFLAEPAHYMLAAVMLVMTVVSYMYYFRILAEMYFRRGQLESKKRMPASMIFVVLICSAGTVLFGLYPNVGLDFLHQHFGGFADFMGN